MGLQSKTETLVSFSAYCAFLNDRDDSFEKKIIQSVNNFLHKKERSYPKIGDGRF